MRILYVGPKPLPKECKQCGGLHTQECEGPHHPACFCERCRGMHYADWFEKALTKENNMNLPDPKSAASGDYAPFLKAKDLPKKGNCKLTLTGDVRESNGQFGDGIDVGVKLGGKVYSWTVKFESGNYRRLIEAFGKNIKKWKSKTVTVTVDKYLGNSYVKIVDN
jgi:hypothetical protein